MRALAAAVVLLLPLAPGAHATEACDPAGVYTVSSKTRVGGKRVARLETGVLPDGRMSLHAIAESEDEGFVIVASSVLAASASGRWRAGGAAAPGEGRMRLRLARCERFVGRIKIRGKASRRLVAVRSVCGDGRVDVFADEDCEPGGVACAGGIACNDRCHCQGGRPELDTTFGIDGVASIAGRRRSFPVRRPARVLGAQS